MSRQGTGPVSANFRRQINRSMLVIAVSAMCVAVQVGIHGAIAGRYVRNLSWRKMHAFLSLSTAAVFIPAGLCFLLLRALLPGVAERVDALLPFSVRPRTIAARKRRDSDADADDAALVAQAGDYHALAGTYGSTLASFLTMLQEPDMADNVLTGFLTLLWHCAMSGPLTVWFFDTGLKGEPRAVYNGLVAVAGLVLAAVDIWALRRGGFWTYSSGSASSSSRVGAGAAQVGRSPAKPGAAAGVAQSQHPRTSSLAIMAMPLLVQGLVSLAFVWLHVDRGGRVHWSPFD